MRTPDIAVRLARDHDLETIEALARRATRDLLGPFLDAHQREASMEFTPLDPWLIEDRTYFVVEIDGAIRASGGWSVREGFIRTNEPLELATSKPSNCTGRLRAMYTDPAMARQGIGRMVVTIVEASARLAGCAGMELLATPVGRLLYQVCGYAVVQEVHLATRSGAAFCLAHMTKDLTRAQAGLGNHKDSRTRLCSVAGIAD